MMMELIDYTGVNATPSRRPFRKMNIAIDSNRYFYSNIRTATKNYIDKFMINNINNIYTLLELKLDSIAEKVLLSKINDDDVILSRVSSHVENVFIQAALKITDNNISKAAKLLGINRNTLSKKIKESFPNKNVKSQM